MSSNLQSKLGEGLSKFQGGIEQGKQKLQIAQEVSRLKKEMNDTSTRKSKVLLEVGQAAYKKIRNGEITDPELIELTTKLVGYDSTIYQSITKITELQLSTDHNQEMICPSCQTANDEHAKFCGSCGEKILVEKLVDTEESEHCVKCEQSIPLDAHFCPCCGNKVGSY
ncbi:zinc ribbon domain-containing protein [Bacillus sp. BGMRC 2118]|nr:zinc ribbon domain-containing protein [Bacillus sp. BGMRC 2118]